jgi:hypothetical protein
VQNCTWENLGDSTLVWSCGGELGGRATSGLTYNLRTHAGSALPAVPVPDEADVESAWWSGIGASWAQAQYSGYHYSATEYVSRTTHEVRDPAPLRNHRLIADPHLPGLWRTLCQPLRTGTVIDDADPTEPQIPGPFAFNPPFGAGLWQRANADGGLTPERILAGSCGGHERAIWRCRIGCSAPVVGSQAAAWIDGGTVLAYMADRRRMWCWANAGQSVALVGRRLFVRDGSELLTARLPSIRPNSHPSRRRSPGCRAAYFP